MSLKSPNMGADSVFHLTQESLGGFTVPLGSAQVATGEGKISLTSTWQWAGRG